MIDRKAIVDEFSPKGCNCAQCTCLAFEDEFDVSREDLFILSAPFGGGMGYFGLTCGALAGAGMVFSNHYGADFIDDVDYKKQFYAAIKEMAEEFEKENGAATCKELLAMQEEGKAPACRQLIYNAIALAERYIEKYDGVLRKRK